MLLIVDAELVKDRVAVLGLRPGVLRLLEVEAAQEHESAIGRVLTVLEALARVGCTVQAAAEHAVRREADLEPIGLWEERGAVVSARMLRVRAHERATRAHLTWMFTAATCGQP